MFLSRIALSLSILLQDRSSSLTFETLLLINNFSFLSSCRRCPNGAYLTSFLYVAQDNICLSCFSVYSSPIFIPHNVLSCSAYSSLLRHYHLCDFSAFVTSYLSIAGCYLRKLSPHPHSRILGGRHSYPFAHLIHLPLLYDKLTHAFSSTFNG